jgi:hypothetical protein
VSWAYSNFRSGSTLAERVRLGRLHMQEISDQISHDTASDGFQKRADSLSRLLEGVRQEVQRYEDQQSSIGGNSGGLSWAQPGTVRA